MFSAGKQTIVSGLWILARSLVSILFLRKGFAAITVSRYFINYAMNALSSTEQEGILVALGAATEIFHRRVWRFRESIPEHTDWFREYS